MQIHADLRQKAIVSSCDLPWIDSPMAGVQRRMLERNGGEVARATSIVRYEPGSAFSAHIHGGGEEFLVLDGVFSDEWGDYEVGTFVRNPVGSRHTPYTRQGCTILVKLWQVPPEDPERVIVKPDQQTWHPGEGEGLSLVVLHRFRTEQITLINLSAGASLPPYSLPGGEEIFVIKGSLEEDGQRYPEGTWIRNPSGGHHQLWSPQGCQIYRKCGHLPVDES